MKKSGGIIASTVRALAEPIARDLGYELWDVEYVKEGADYYSGAILLDADPDGERHAFPKEKVASVRTVYDFDADSKD